MGDKKLIQTIQKVASSPSLLDLFLRDLLTHDEIRELKKRLCITEELYRGTPHRIIAKKLGVGIATVTRGSRMLQNKKGGFYKFFHQYEK